MDIMQDYALLALNTLHTAEPYTRPILRFLTDLRTQCTPLLLPYLNRAASLAQDSPAILSLGVLLLLLIVAMQILAFFRRIMMFWVKLVARLLFWGAFGFLLAVVWQRGVGRTASDLGSWIEELRAVWWREYRRWEGYQNREGGLGQAQGRGSAGSSWR